MSVVQPKKPFQNQPHKPINTPSYKLIIAYQNEVSLVSVARSYEFCCWFCIFLFRTTSIIAELSIKKIKANITFIQNANWGKCEIGA